MAEGSIELPAKTLRRNVSSPSFILTLLSADSQNTAVEETQIELSVVETFVQKCKSLKSEIKKILNGIVTDAVQDFEQVQQDISIIKNQICILSKESDLSKEDIKLWTGLLRKLEVTHLCLHVKQKSIKELNEKICNPAFTKLFFAIAQQKSKLKKLVKSWKIQKESSAEWILFIAAIMRREDLGIEALRKNANYQRVCKWVFSNCEAEQYLIMAHNFWNNTFKELQIIKQAYDKRVLKLSDPNELENEFQFIEPPTLPMQEYKAESKKTDSVSAEITPNNISTIGDSQYNSTYFWGLKSSPDTSATPKTNGNTFEDESSVLNYDLV